MVSSSIHRSEFMNKLPLFLLLFLSACLLPYQGRKVLSHSSAFTHPIWLSDGRELIGTTINASVHKFQIYGFDTVTKKKHLWFETSNDIYAEDISPDGKSILISSLLGSEFNAGLWVIDAEETTTRYLLDEGTSGIFSPDGKKVMIYSCTFDQGANQKVASIYLIDLVTRERTLFFNKRVDCLSSAYLSISSSSEYLAFSYQYGNINDSQNDLNILRLSDHQVNQLDPDAWSPSWAPDGNVLVYVKGDQETKNSMVFWDLHNNCSTSVAMDIGEVAWSPTGKQIGIAYSGDLISIEVDEWYENGKLRSELCR
jgi:Tol biopolymer transport system component